MHNVWYGRGFLMGCLGFMQGVIGPGGVQWMTAGRGIVHSEMPKVTEGDLWGFQLWINLPAQDKMVKPRWAYPGCSPCMPSVRLLCDCVWMAKEPYTVHPLEGQRFDIPWTGHTGLA